MVHTGFSFHEQETQYKSDHKFTCKRSYIDHIEFNNNNTLEVKQTAELETNRGNSETVHVNYLLEIYKANSNFQPTVSPQKNKVGFFEITSTYNNLNESQVLASKFDINKKIKFAISDNTPEEYKKAIRDGVLYWNKVFNSSVLEVTNAPKGLRAPSYKHNMIQWVDWADAGFAYADAQMDQNR